MKKIFSALFFFFFFNTYLYAQYEEEFSSRAALLIDHVADEYAANSPGWKNDDPSVPDPEKYAWPSVMARFEKYGTADAMGNVRIETFRNNSPFHFPFVGMARIMALYPDAPKMIEHKKVYLENVWKRTDSFNAWTGEGTENHINMNRTSAYLYTQYALEESYDNELFNDAQGKQAAMKEWILAWSKKVYESGTAEWNSSTYGVHNIVGWLNLYDFAEDEEVKQAARAVLDYYAAELALHYSQGISGGAEMRGGSAYTSIKSDTDYLSWLWFGDSPRKITFDNNPPIFSMYAASSGYRPPGIAVKLANKTLTKPAMYYGSKPSYLFNQTSYVKHTLFIDEDYTLGAAFVPYGGWSGGDWQIVSWKLVGRVDADESNLSKTADFVSGGGMYFQNRGLHRKPFDQLAHHENVLIQLSKVPLNATAIKAEVEQIFDPWLGDWRDDFIKRFPTENWKNNQQIVKFQSQDVTENSSYITIRKKDKNIQFQSQNNVLFVKLEKVFMAIRSIYQDQPSPAEIVGDYYKISDSAPSLGLLTGFIVEVGNTEDYTSLEAFIAQINANTVIDKSAAAAENKIVYRNLKGDEIEVEYVDEGSFTEPIYDWGYGVAVQQVEITSPPFQQPEWPSGMGHGKLANWSVNGEEIALEENWPVYEGSNLVLKDSKLTLVDSVEKLSYTVDYSGVAPDFDNGETVTGMEETGLNNMLEIFSYPNPSQGSTKIVYLLPVSTKVRLTLFDSQGNKIDTLIKDEYKIKGRHELDLLSSNLPSGKYFCSISARSAVVSTKILLIR